MLHPPKLEGGYEDKVELGEGILDPCVFFQPGQGRGMQGKDRIPVFLNLGFI